jgi:hypothetical protein
VDYNKETGRKFEIEKMKFLGSVAGPDKEN